MARRRKRTDMELDETIAWSLALAISITILFLSLYARM